MKSTQERRNQPTAHQPSSLGVPNGLDTCVGTSRSPETRCDLIRLSGPRPDKGAFPIMEEPEASPETKKTNPEEPRSKCKIKNFKNKPRSPQKLTNQPRNTQDLRNQMPFDLPGLAMGAWARTHGFKTQSLEAEKPAQEWKTWPPGADKP